MTKRNLANTNYAIVASVFISTFFVSSVFLLDSFLLIPHPTLVRNPPKMNINPAITNGATYDFVLSYIIPQTIGPIKHPIPLNNCKSPNVVAKYSIPNMSISKMGMATM